MVHPLPSDLDFRYAAGMSSFANAHLRVLLLQARTDEDPARNEEHQSFAHKTGLAAERIVQHNLLDGPPSIRATRAFDALMMGGSGDFFVSKRNLPKLDDTLDYLGEITDLGHPTFASCFGFQCLVEAHGGAIIHDPDHMELGTYPLGLTEDGRADPLLGILPTTFSAQMGRKDRADSLPEGFRHLAASDAAPYQAIRLRDEPVWATQFHPELDGVTNKARYLRYVEGYSGHLGEAERERILERFTESPETDRLLPRFLDLVFG